MVCLGLCMEQQPCPLIVEGLSPHLSTTFFQFALVCSLCASFDAAGQPLEKRVLMECETRFFQSSGSKGCLSGTLSEKGDPSNCCR